MEHKTYIEEREKIKQILVNFNSYMHEDNPNGETIMVDYESFVDKILSTISHDLLNKINDWAEENKQKLPEGKCLNAENHLFGSCFQCEKIKGNNQALSDLQTYLISLGK